MAMSYVEVSQKELKFLDFTSLTVEEFEKLVPVFEEKFRERMKKFRLDGKPRVGREYQTYSNCPLPSPEDRLLFILVYLKTNNLQIVQGELFGLPQNKANQWIHTLLPVLLATMRSLGDAPARSVEELTQRLSQRVLIDEVSSSPHASCDLPDVSASSSNAGEVQDEQAKPENVSPPLFAMMARSDASSARKIMMNRKTIIVERKNVMQ
jgi:Helix-turn-helix of DDE superfamily endonuclease